MPFLVDSVTMELNRQNLTVHYTAHPVFVVNRDKDGKAIDFPLAEVLECIGTENAPALRALLDKMLHEPRLTALSDAAGPSLAVVRMQRRWRWRWRAMRQKTQRYM